MRTVRQVLLDKIKRQARVGSEKNEKIGERNLEQEVNWRRLKKFRENWRSFEMLKEIKENWRKKSMEFFLNKQKKTKKS